ncbi:MAG: hypothetical protein QXW79_01025 [Thermoplasmata archaeon]
MEINNIDLYGKYDRLAQLKKESYDKLYRRCVNQIKIASNSGELICFFEVPKFLFGSSYPIINVESCAQYIISKLSQTNKNIKAEFVEPNIIFIDWRRSNDPINENI